MTNLFNQKIQSVGTLVKKGFFDKTAVISYSGGMDSTCLMMHLLSHGYQVYAYSFDYGQAHSYELKMAKRNIKYLLSLGLPVSHQIINVRDVFSGDTSTLVMHQQSPSGDYRDETMKSTVVNNRNVIFSSIIYAKALSIAKRNYEELKSDSQSEKDLRCKAKVIISLGVHAGDHAIYPDCTEESVNMAKELFRISNWDSDLVEYDTPFVNYPKSEVLAAGLDAMHNLDMNKRQINRILKNTSSCYNVTNGLACGECGTCRERIEAFEINNIKDPIRYA